MNTTDKMVAHILAMAVAGTFAWFLAATPLMTSGLMFVAPVILVITVHALLLRNPSVEGFFVRVVRRTSGSIFMLVAAVLLIDIVTPSAAQADVEGIVMYFMSIVVCLIIVALVGGFVFLVLSLLIGTGRAVAKAVRPGRTPPDTRRFELGSLMLLVAGLGIASFEGAPGFYRFNTKLVSEYKVQITAPIDRVWVALETATSPAFPLPVALASFPQPMDITIDEGVSFGAKRQVAFTGREGAGHLTLQVVERTENRVVLQVLSYTTPYADWMGLQSITYQMEQTAGGTLLTTRLHFDRHLAPALIMGPLMRQAGNLAMGVLARDVAGRAGG